MSFIIESRRPGEIVTYVSRSLGTGYRLSADREKAEPFNSDAHARVIARRFSSLYNLIITEITP